MSERDTDLRFLRWLGTFGAPDGTEIQTVSTTIGRLVRRGLIERHAMYVRLTGFGIDLLLENGWIPSVTGPRGDRCACPCHTTDIRHKLNCCPPDAARHAGAGEEG